MPLQVWPMKTEYFMRWPEASASEFFFATIPIAIGTRMFCRHQNTETQKTTEYFWNPSPAQAELNF
jgi:hypothetical protein